MQIVFFDGFRAARGLMWTILGLSIVRALAQSFFALGFKVFVDAAVDQNRIGMTAGVVLSGTLIAVFWYTANLDANIGFGLVDRMELYISTRTASLLTAIHTIDHFEDPAQLRELDLLERNRDLLRSGPRQTLNAIASVIRGVAMVAILATVHPVMTLLPLFGLAPAFAQSWSVRIRQRAEEEAAEDLRLATELFRVATTASTAKEVRIYGLGNEIAARHHDAARRGDRRIALAALRGAALTALGWLVFVVGFIGTIALIVRRTIDGGATAGDVVLVVVMSQQARLVLSEVANEIAVLLTTSKVASRVVWLQSLHETSPLGTVPWGSRALTTGIELRSASFRYPGSDLDVLDRLSVHLPAGRTIAIAGANGSGKTTLVKLLLGLHRPTSGRILVDGVDLADLDPATWRAALAGAFQDHVHFEMSAGTSIGIGDLPRVDDDDAIGAALMRASAADVVEGLTHGLATPVGTSFVGGADLSDGQWQKLALARGVMLDRPALLVLDEPSANLDAEAEHDLFRRLLDAMEHQRSDGTIIVFVTHRLSTARLADLIVLVDDGRVVELGSHDELMTAGGLYAELFTLQARAYA